MLLHHGCLWLHQRSQRAPLEMLDLLHKVTERDREGLRVSALPSALEFVKVLHINEVNTSRLIICKLIQHIPQGLGKDLKLLGCTTVTTFEDTEVHGKSHPKFQHQFSQRMGFFEVCLVCFYHKHYLTEQKLSPTPQS